MIEPNVALPGAIHSAEATLYENASSIGARFQFQAPGSSPSWTGVGRSRHRALSRKRQPRAVIVALLKAGADPTVRSEDGITSLHLSALSNDSSAVIKALLGAGADPASRNVLGLTPLHMAAMTRVRTLDSGGATLHRR